MSNVFISYRRQDSAGYARAIFNSLRQHFPGGRVFMDVDNIQPGVDFVEVIEEAVGSCTVLLAIIGRRWLSAENEKGRRLDDPDDFVALEIASALGRNIRVIPVLVDGAFMPGQQDLPERLARLARRNALELSHGRFDADMARLIDVLKRVLPETDQAPAAAPSKPARMTLEAFEKSLLPKIKLELGQLIERENARPVPAEYSDLLSTTSLDVIIRNDLAKLLADEADRIREDLTRSCHLHGLMYGRDYAVQLWSHDDPDSPQFQVRAHAEQEEAPAPGPAAPTQSATGIRQADPDGTILFGGAFVHDWEPGRWILVASGLEGTERQVFRLTEPQSTVGRGSKSPALTATFSLTGAPRSISRRQIAIEWSPEGTVPAFRVYNLGRSPVQVGEQRIPGAALSSGPPDLPAIEHDHSARVFINERFHVPPGGVELWIEETVAEWDFVEPDDGAGGT